MMGSKPQKDRGPVRAKEHSRRRKSDKSHRDSSPSPKEDATRSTGSVSRRKKDSVVESSTSRILQLQDSPSSSKTSLPYPTFSKAHSKESVSRDISVDVFTPNPTDVAAVPHSRSGGPKARDPTQDRKERVHVASGVPPSPPLTSISKTTRSRASEKEALNHAEDVEETGAQKKNGKSERPGSGRSGTLPDSTHDLAPLKQPKPYPIYHPATVSTEVGSTVDSEATSATEVLAQNERPLPQGTVSRTISNTEASGISIIPDGQEVEHLLARENFIDEGPREVPWGAEQSPRPPPPPPPPVMPLSTPRVDYLLLNGGLTRRVPRRLLEVLPHSAQQQSTSPYQQSPRIPTEAVSKIFAPFHQLLREYETVISNNGSVAVATGYRSIARKLLDRLEAVFARDLSSELCKCSLCQRSGAFEEAQYGLGWGDVLEWVSGRKPLPSWPPLDFGALGRAQLGDDHSRKEGTTKGIFASESSPFVRTPSVDADVPAEFRDHYRRQTKKKKQAVDRWLAGQLTNPTSPPQGVDDETLSFAILTHLEQTERDDFKELISSSPFKASEPEAPANENTILLSRTSTALQRLYRLPTTPRPPECAAFLVTNPDLHHVLAALAAVNPSEWDILTSGRFNGFLWSGADDVETFSSPRPSTAPNLRSRGPSRASGFPTLENNSPAAAAVRAGSPREASTGIPFQSIAAAASQGATPAPGPPVSHDEETEIAVLAEIEREIYIGMEALEDAFEALHKRAESVRLALRERGAGLSMAGQLRRPTWPSDGGTSEYGRAMSGYGFPADVESEDDAQWGSRDTADAVSDVWPDDSASNVSTSRVRRPKRRTERRTPALVEEREEEDED